MAPVAPDCQAPWQSPGLGRSGEASFWVQKPRYLWFRVPKKETVGAGLLMLEMGSSSAHPQFDSLVFGLRWRSPIFGCVGPKLKLRLAATTR